MPLLRCAQADVRNNVIWGWEGSATHVSPAADGDTAFNIVNNYYRSDRRPENALFGLRMRGQALSADMAKAKEAGHQVQIYIDGNDFPKTTARTAYGTKGVLEAIKNFGMPAKLLPMAPVTTQPVKEAYELVLKYAGIRPRDAYDQDVVENYVRQGRFKAAPPRHR